MKELTSMGNLIAVSSILLWAVLLFNLLLSFAIIRRLNKTSKNSISNTGLKIGDRPASFSAFNLAKDTIRSEDFEKQNLLLMFVSPRCSVCREHMPILDKVYSKAKAAGFELLTISLGEHDATQALINEIGGYTSPILVAPRNANRMAFDYSVMGTPWYYWIDTDGVIKSGGYLDKTWEDLITGWENAE